MKLTIEINENIDIETYLSIISLGTLDALEKEIINCDDAMNLIYFPGLIDKLEKLVPNLGEAVHLGTELENVKSLIPEKFNKSIEQIRKLNYNSIKKMIKNKQIAVYSLER